jgi:hypothetical protein
MAATEVVVGSTRKTLTVVILDGNNVPLDISGGSVRLQGTSEDLPGINIDQPGTITDPVNGVCKWSSIGTLITADNLGSLDFARYKLRVKLTTATSLIDYGAVIELTFYPTPI